MGEQWHLNIPPPSTIHVDELTVRRYEESDASALVRSVTESLEHLRPWMPWIKFEPQSVEQRRTMIAEWTTEWESGRNFTMGVFMGDEVVAGSGLHLRGDPGILEIGYWVNVRHTRRGVATRVSRALTDVAFGLNDVDEVRIGHDVNNETSGRVPAALGYVVVDEHKRVPEAPGEAGVVRYWSMSRDRWAELSTTRGR